MSASSFAIDVPSSLLTRVRSGDMRAFEQLYRLFERPVYGLAVRMLGDPHEAMEVVHDALLKVHDTLSGFRGESPFWGWLRQIAVNEALMRLRRRGRQELGEALPEPAADLDASPPPLRFAEAAELEQALSGLPETTRSVLWLYHAEGYTHEEIAALMGRTASFSKSQLARGTQRLRLILTRPTEASHVG